MRTEVCKPAYVESGWCLNFMRAETGNLQLFKRSDDKDKKAERLKALRSQKLQREVMEQGASAKGAGLASES